MTQARHTQDAVIIGGGIIGCTLAWELAKAGITSRIFDRREIAREASWASAGIISPPGPRQASRVNLALRSYERYPSLIAEVEELTGQSVGYVQSGVLELAKPASADQLRETFRWQLDHGVDVQWVDADAIREIEPAILSDYTQGIVTSGTGSVILSRMTTALARAAQTRGAQIHEHTPVHGIVVDGGRATGVQTFDGVIPTGLVIIAAGAWSRTLGESLDFTIPSVPVRGQMLAIADPPIPLRRVISAGGGYFVPRADGTIAIGATEEREAGFETNVTPAGVAWLTDLIRSVAPSLLDGRLHQTWAGLRPATEDGEPIIGRIPHLDNVWIATGHFRSGALLAPATAEAITASIVSGEVDPLIAPFAPARLA